MTIDMQQVREAAERLRQSFGVIGHCPWETAVYQGLPWASPRAAYNKDCEAIAMHVINSGKVLVDRADLELAVCVMGNPGCYSDNVDADTYIKVMETSRRLGKLARSDA